MKKKFPFPLPIFRILNPKMCISSRSFPPRAVINKIVRAFCLLSLIQFNNNRQGRGKSGTRDRRVGKGAITNTLRERCLEGEDRDTFERRESS